MKQNKQKIYYDQKTDTLWLNIKNGVEERYEEVLPGVNVELGKKGRIIRNRDLKCL